MWTLINLVLLVVHLALAEPNAFQIPTFKSSQDEICPSNYKNETYFAASLSSERLKLGVSYDHVDDINMDRFEYVTIWLSTISKGSSSTRLNKYYQGNMLRMCRKYKKVPLFYAYVIAFEARATRNINDCDVDPDGNNLCRSGADFIRHNRHNLVFKYWEHARKIARIYGSTDPIIFIIEPDFWQYYGDLNQHGGPLSGTYMRELFDDFVKAIKSHLPKASISWDLSPWVTEEQFEQWWNYFADADIDFISTSGGQSRADLNAILQGKLNWSFVHYVTGKKIIADCGYGIGGKVQNNCDQWLDRENEKARINDGLYAISVANPTSKVFLDHNLTTENTVFKKIYRCLISILKIFYYIL